MHSNFGAGAGALQNAEQLGADGIGEGDVRHHPVAEKRGDAAARAIKKLVREDKRLRGEVFAQRADGAEGDNALHAELLQAVDVGAEIQFRRQNAMPPAVPCQKRQPLSVQRAEHVGIRRRAPRRFHRNLFDILQTRQRIQPAAADDADLRLCHFRSRLRTTSRVFPSRAFRSQPA